MRNISIRVLGNKFMTQGESVYLSLVPARAGNARLRPMADCVFLHRPS